MALNDIIVHQSPHGGSPLIRYYPLNASQTFFKGEVVRVNGDGEVTETATEPSAANVTGIAMAGPGTTATALRNPKTNTTWATGDRVPVSIPSSDVLYRTENWTVAGSAFDDTAPAATDIGETVSLALISGVWGVDNGPGANAAIGRVEDILNASMESILITGETLLTTDTFHIVFSIIAHTGTPDSGEAVDPIA